MKISVIGATGYSGVELLRLLSLHPEAEIVSLYSNASSGKTLPEVFPHMTEIETKTLESVDIERIAKEAELVFIATPSGVSNRLVPGLLDAGLRVIDLSGDFRLRDPETYEKWYGKKTAERRYLQRAVYGLSEWNRKQIAQAQLIANPGCYPTATLLGLLPLLQAGVIDSRSIIVDAKSGVSGAGRSVSLGVHFSEVNENLSAYKVGRHQHTPEIEQVLHALTGKEAVISFTPHLIPMTRGILATIYATLAEPAGLADLQGLFEQAYKGAKFVRVRAAGSHPKTKEVYGSNYCDIAVHLDARTNRVIVLSVIDNVVKGAAGQAVQNMNIMFGLPEETGLEYTPVFP
ncbi:N-acetyl-gamma-glutamyl-phosphate reductase [Bacillaceae bacterium]